MQSAKLFMGFLLLTTVHSGHAQLEITGSTPKQASIAAGFAGPVEIVFDRDIDYDSITPNTVKIFGSFHGYYDYRVLPASRDGFRRVSLAPSPAFIDGESVTVMVTREVRALDGARLDAPFRLHFRIQNPRGDIYRSFVDSVDIFLPPDDQQPVKIAVGDFYRDDFLDFAVINSTSNTVTVFRNLLRANRTLKFEVTASYPTGLTPLDLKTADFDQDGELDLAVVGFNSNDLRLYWGRGNGTFVESPAPLPVGLRPTGIALDDFNGDGRIDLAVSLLGEDKVVLFENTGNRNFVRGQELECESGTFGVAASDFDADGLVDLSAINNGAQSVSIFRNLGNGAWETLGALSVPLKPIGIKAGNVFSTRLDSTYDTYQDFVVLSSDLTLLGKGTDGRTVGKSEFTVLSYEPGSRNLVAVQSLAFASRAQGFALGNLDSQRAFPSDTLDHDLDLILANYVGGTVEFLSNEDGQAWAESYHRVDLSPQPREVVLADFNRDGSNDILFANHLLNKLRLLVVPALQLGGGDLDVCTGFAGPYYSVDFGAVQVGTTQQIELPVVFQSSLDLNVSVDLQENAVFDVQPRTFQVRDGQPFPLTLSFSPNDTSEFQTRVLLTSDHPLECAPGVIELRGRGIDLGLSITPQELNFNSVPPGLSKTLTLLVTNSGNGLLQLTSLTSSLPEYSHPTDTVLVPPYGEITLPVTFSPNALGEYRDTLVVASNDIDVPVVRIPLIGKGATGRPQITSPDTITAVEHQFMLYRATAVDPDGDVIDFRYRDLATWLSASVDSVYGVPPEGAQDTDFWVIASDGILEDSLRVHVNVIPVNDPPRFESLDVQEVIEQDLLNFEVRAIDPENEPLRLTAQNLPQGATFRDQGNNTGAFSWTPPFGAQGTYDVTFMATETISTPALSDTLVVRINVGRRKPDISVQDLQLSRSDIRLNQDAFISARVVNSNAPVTESFVVRISVDGTTRFDTTIVGMEVDASLEVRTRVKFDRLGTINVEVAADVQNAVAETNEGNNRLSTAISITQGELIVRPNPFTPNNDGKNDRAVFDLRHLAFSQPSVTIFNVNGQVIRKLTYQGNQQIAWDGKDASGIPQLPGVYLFILQDGQTSLGKGYVVLAR